MNRAVSRLFTAFCVMLRHGASTNSREMTIDCSLNLRSLLKDSVDKRYLVPWSYPALLTSMTH